MGSQLSAVSSLQVETEKHRLEQAKHIAESQKRMYVEVNPLQKFVRKGNVLWFRVSRCEWIIGNHDRGTQKIVSGLKLTTKWDNIEFRLGEALAMIYIGCIQNEFA